MAYPVYDDLFDALVAEKANGRPLGGAAGDAESAHAFPNPENYVQWREFLRRPEPVKPELPSRAEYSALPHEERARIDRLRVRYHNSFGPIRSATMEQVHREVLRKVRDNIDALPGARQGAIIDGLGTHGKTTILLQLGRIFESRIREAHQRQPGGVHYEYIPVVYRSVPSSATPKDLLKALNAFYGNPYGLRDSAAELKSKLCECAVQCRTSLFLLDDIHNLHRGNKSAESVNDLIKELANLIPATFVHAGINCEQSVLLMDGKTGRNDRFTQTQYRFALYRVKPFPYDVDEQGSQWLSLLATLEEHLCLYGFRKGFLVQQHLYLYLRTQGIMGAITALVRAAANNAIRDKSETLTVKSLEEVTLSYGADERYRELRKKVAQIKKDPAAVKALLKA